MRLLHTADLHLGKVLHEQSLLEDQAEVLSQLRKELQGGGYDLFLIAGDVFDRSVPPPEAVALWDDFLVGITGDNPALQTVVISGNHDGPLRLSYASRFLASHRVHLRTRTEELHVPLTFSFSSGEVDVFAVPFLPAGSLEVARDQDVAALRSQRDLWEEALRRIASQRRPGVTSLLVAHLFTVGGAESDSERIFLGEAEQIPASWLSGWDYVALGHLHRAQEPAPGVRYSGSPLAYSFSEAGQNKGAWRWEDGQAKFVPLVPKRPLTRLSGTFEDFARGDQYQAYASHWLELTLTDPALVPGPMERLRPRFPGLLSLVQTPALSATSTEPQRRRTGDVAADALRFLGELGSEPSAEVQKLVTSLAQEASVEAP